MPSRSNPAGQKLRLRQGHWEWADWQAKTLPDNTVAMWVACEAPTLDGTPGGHYLAPDVHDARRVVVQTAVYGWPDGHAAFEARDRWERQERQEGRG